MNEQVIRQAVANYYTEKLVEHGPTAQGVDWNSVESQQLRFRQLLKVVDAPLSSFSLNDLGCGYGALLSFLKENNYACTYLGIDCASLMIEKAREIWQFEPQVRFICAPEPDGEATYTVASGIFNVKLKESNQSWRDYILANIEILNRCSSKGFAFNMLTSYSDAHRQREDLYYGDPCFYFDLCKNRFSKNVALLHDYNLYEFTIVVRK